MSLISGLGLTGWQVCWGHLIFIFMLLGLLGGKYSHLQSQTSYEPETVTTLLPFASSGLLWHPLLALSLKK